MLFVFMSQPDFACNPHALYKYIDENTDCETAWILKRDERYEELKKRGIRCAIYNTLEGNKLIQEADYVVMNSYTFASIPKRKGQVFVNLWHGSGVKSHDFYNHDLRPKQVRNLKKFFSMIDLMCVHSLDDRFRLTAMLNYDLRRVYVTGQPRLDCVVSSNGREKLAKLYGESILKYDKLIFYTPSFRANASSHSGSLVSENIFRLADYESGILEQFLEENNAAIIYKLHPIEQTAFKGRKFLMGDRCLELNEDMLFDSDIRYDEILNAFDLMITDYSSIAFDFLLLDRPIIYLIPDYEEYNSERGFVFNNVEKYMPGEKVFCFQELMSALKSHLMNLKQYHDEREFVLEQRFDYRDGKSSERCYQEIINFVQPVDEIEEQKSTSKVYMPSAAEHLLPYLNGNYRIVDSTKNDFTPEEKQSLLDSDQEIWYIMSEIPLSHRKLTGQSSVEIADYEFYDELKKLDHVKLIHVNGGVDYNKFVNTEKNSLSDHKSINKEKKLRIGFAGTIDKRIYFAMVQYISEAFPDADVIFAGAIMGEHPIWLNGYDNLQYVETSYEDLPAVISSFDICILPFFGRHQKYVPTELFQYLAAGKQVVTSNMTNLPECSAILTSVSIADAVENIKVALKNKDNIQIIDDAKRVAKENDWSTIAKNISNSIM